MYKKRIAIVNNRTDEFKNIEVMVDEETGLRIVLIGTGVESRRRVHCDVSHRCKKVIESKNKNVRNCFLNKKIKTLKIHKSFDDKYKSY